MESDRTLEELKGLFEGRSALLIEDNLTNRVVEKAILSKIGFDVSEASDGLEGVSLSKLKTFDLILMDCVMPELDGYEATKKIRSDASNPNKDTPIIALSASAFDEDREACIQAGMNDFIDKPIGPEKAVKVIERWVSAKDTDPLPSSDEAEPIDVPKLIELFGGDKEIADTVLRNLKKTLREDFQNLSEQLKANPLTEASRQTAHSIKGSAANCFAVDLSSVASKMEVACREGNRETALTLLPKLSAETSRTLDYLDRLYP